MARTAVRVIATEKCVRAAMLFAVRCFMRLMERSVPYIIVAPITISSANEVDYICITDMATAKSDNSRAADIIKNWLRNRNTLELRKLLKNCSILQSYG